MNQLQLSTSEHHPNIRTHRKSMFSATAKSEDGVTWRINMFADFVPSQNFETLDPITDMVQLRLEWLHAELKE